MKLIDTIARRFGYFPRRSAPRVVINNRAGYNAASSSRLTADWLVSTKSQDGHTHSAIQVLRDRGRDLSRNDDYAKSFLRLCKGNVVGSKGFNLSMDVTTPRFDPSQQQVVLESDMRANELIEEAYKDFSKPVNFTVSGRLSRRMFEALAITTIARDGETLIRLVRGNDYKYGIALLPYEAEQMDHTFNKRLPNGNLVRMGVELNQLRKPVAYWLYESNPDDDHYAIPSISRKHVRIPATEMLHAFVPDFLQQTRGTTWFHAAMGRINMLTGYEDAELVAAKGFASKMGFLTKAQDAPGGYNGDGTDDQGNLISEFTPGVIEELPPGYDFKSFDPTHPTTTFESFRKAILRGVASGLGVTYAGLGADMESVNFSSARVAVLDERDMWLEIQAWFIEMICIPIFEAWLDTALLTPNLNLPTSKFEKFNRPRFHGRRWAWVSPERDQAANESAIRMSLKSRGEIIAETQTGDFEDVVRRIAREEAIAKKYGIDLNATLNLKPGSVAPSTSTDKPGKPDDESESDDSDSDEQEEDADDSDEQSTGSGDA